MSRVGWVTPSPPPFFLEVGLSAHEPRKGGRNQFQDWNAATTKKRNDDFSGGKEGGRTFLLFPGKKEAGRSEEGGGSVPPVGLSFPLNGCRHLSP